MKVDKVIIASDHAGYGYKEYIKSALKAENIPYIDCGTDSESSVDYPVFAEKLAEAIHQSGEGASVFGIVLCGSGIGVSIAANRYPYIRAALCYNEEIARLAREHNNANVLALGARFLEKEEALRLVHRFLGTSFAGERHAERVKQLGAMPRH